MANEAESLPKMSKDMTMKTVAYYDPNNEMNRDSISFADCPYYRCRSTKDVQNADAVIFIATKLKRAAPPSFKRNTNQIWIFKTIEAPSRFSWFLHLKNEKLRTFFNWTITYKLDSDIPISYGKLLEKSDEEIPRDKDYDAIFDSKTKMTAWFVSHCPVRSERAMYVERMRKRMDVDVFGKCGDKLCGMAEKVAGVTRMRRVADNTTCFPMLSAGYKFYLAFENSLCQEYITEKYFKLFQVCLV